MTQRRQVLVAALAVVAVGDILLLAAHPSHPATGAGNTVWFAVEESFVRPRSQAETQRRILVLRREGRWVHASGTPVRNLKEYVRSSSATIIRDLAGSYPPIFDIPVFISIGREASIHEFTEALAILRSENICWVGFEELAQPDRFPSGERYEGIPALKIC